MNKLKTLAIASLSVIGFSSFAHETATDITYVGDTTYKNFCKAVTQDNVRLLRKSFEGKVGIVAGNTRATYEKLLNAENLTCNGMGILEFSKARNAVEIVAYLEKKAATL